MLFSMSYFVIHISYKASMKIYIYIYKLSFYYLFLINMCMPLCVVLVCNLNIDFYISIYVCVYIKRHNLYICFLIITIYMHQINIILILNKILSERKRGKILNNQMNMLFQLF
jgi:hypothetical protein